MAQKDFYLQIGDDKVHFHRLEVDPETNTTIIPEEQNLNNIFSSNPIIIDVSHLDYVPFIDTVWDGENFIDSQEREKYPVRQNVENPKRFSFTVDNKHKLYMVMADNEINAMKIAAFLSNPIVVSEIK